MSVPHSGPNWSTDFVEHVRTVHFTLIGVCATLLVLSISRTQTEVQVAHKQIRQIREFIGMAQPYEKLLLPDWLKDGARARLNEMKNERLKFRDKLSGPDVPPPEANAIEFSLHDIKCRAPLRFDDSNSYLWDWKPRQQADGMGPPWEHRQVWKTLTEPPTTLEGFRNWWDRAGQVFLDVPYKLSAGYASEVGSAPKLIPGVHEGLPQQTPWGFVPIRLTLLNDEVESSPLKAGSDLLLQDYSAREISDLRTINPSFNAEEHYLGTVGCVPAGSIEKKMISLSIPIWNFASVPYDAQSVLISHAKKEWDWKHGAFEYSFRELSELTRDYEKISLDAGESVLAGEEKRAGGSFEVVGVKFPAEAVTRWGIVVIIAIQIYLWIHLQELSPRLRRSDPGWDVAWIGVYTSKHARIAMFVLTCLLPSAAVLGVGIRGLYVSSFAKANWVLLIVGTAATSALGILAWKRLPRMNERHVEHASERQS